MKNKKMYFLLLIGVLFISGCAKRITQNEPEEVIKVENEARSNTERPRFIHAGIQGSDENGIYSYYIIPEENEVEIELVGDTEEDWRIYSSELISFSESDEGLEFTYLNEEGEEIEKNFDILSESIVIDEEKNRYEW